MFISCDLLLFSTEQLFSAHTPFMKEQTTLMNDFFFFGSGILSLFMHLHELPLGVQNDISCDNGILHYTTE